MTAILVCILAMVASFWAGRRSLGKGLIALLTVGYFYGIIRANLLTVFSHFVFDAALLGLYLSQKWTAADRADSKRIGILRTWLLLLIVWPCLLVVLPFQPLLVSLVGLRGNIFFIPVALLGSKLEDKDLQDLSRGLAVLNLAALGFAIAEYFMGLPRFYPVSPVTQIIYASGDIEGGFFRIPATFVNAHAYGGTMVGSLPYLLGLWSGTQTRKARLLAVCGTVAALLGILFSAARLNFLLGAAMVTATLFTTRMRKASRAIFVLILAAVGWTAMSNVRLQRFKSLSDTEYVTDRIAGSVNRSFFEILTEYPMGNGLGGGGTSIPYFLQGEVKNPIGMENEYARILAEQGVIGLLLWLGFILWFLTRAQVAFGRESWTNAKRMAWCLGVVSLGTAWIGVGLFTAIPQTTILLLSIGWTTTPTRRPSLSALGNPVVLARASLPALAR